MIEGQAAAPKHPKAALQEWALARGRRPPEYEIVSREGPDHAPRFRVAVSVGKLARAEAEGASKQAAEKAAAAALLAEPEGQEKWPSIADPSRPSAHLTRASPPSLTPPSPRR